MTRRRLLSIGMGVLLLVGVIGGAGLGGAVAPAENPLDVNAHEDEDTGGKEENEQEEREEQKEREEHEEREEAEEDEEEPVNLSRLQVSAQEAIATAENETNGTVVGLELTTEAPAELGAENETEAENETTDENETLVWEVELVTQDGTEKEVLIDATDGTVLGVETEAAEEEEAENGDAETDDADAGNETDDADANESAA